MLKYCLKRLLLAIAAMFVVVAVTFFAMNAVPGGPFDSEKAPSPEVMRVLNERYHLDKPLGVQFGMYLRNLLGGDFGVSIKTGRSISAIIGSSFRVSARLGWRAIVMAVAFGVLLGCLAAQYSNRWPDRIIVFASSLMVSVPSFVTASFLMWFFCLKLKWVPAWTADNSSYVLPVIALSLFPMANVIRLTKASVLDALNQNYIRNARAKGLPEWKVLFKHAFRNAIIPVITYTGPMIAGALTGSVVIETVFTMGGLGSQFVYGITNRDYTLVMGLTVFMAAIIITVTFVSDILYKMADPRIKF